MGNICHIVDINLAKLALSLARRGRVRTCRTFRTAAKANAPKEKIVV